MRRWANLVPPSVQICPVEIPGRGRRFGEPAPADIDSLAETLLAALPLQVQTLLLTGAGVADDWCMQ